MPKILIVKTTSLGDLVHTMPAITDMQRMVPDAELHWLVEESFADVPRWHPFVTRVYTCAIRRWRKSLLNSATRKEIRTLKKDLQAENYDLVIDAQGLVKSAWMVSWLDCAKHGYDQNSIKEKLASRVYTHQHSISREQGAIERVRQLFAKVMGYSLENLSMQFGMLVDKPDGAINLPESDYAVFLHGTNWESKIWPVDYWKQLAGLMAQKVSVVFLPWGSEQEHKTAQAIAEGTPAEVLPRQSLHALAYILQNASVVIGSDTGLTHIAAALGSVTVGIYGSTNCKLTGLIGDRVKSLQSEKSCSPCMKRQCPLINEGEMIPCYQSVNPEFVMSEIRRQLKDQ